LQNLEENMTSHEMSLTRLMDVPADKLFRCWTEPSLMKQWFAPKPYTTPVAEVDLRPGGASDDEPAESGGADVGTAGA